jgi:hypothetical protein
MAKKKKETDTEESQTDSYDDLSGHFFRGGKHEVRKRLVAAVKRARVRKKISAEELDMRCLLKKGTCAKFEKDPSQITQEVFCRAACALELKVDKILRINFDAQDNLDHAMKAMVANNGGLAAALSTEPGTKAKDIPYDKVAPVYATLKVLSEI